MNVTFICFSQTGNTKKVARAMARAFEEAGETARVVPLNRATKVDALEADLLAVGAPCFASQAPTPIKQWVAGLPRLDGKKAFVFATSGGAPGRVLHDLTRELTRRGAEVLGGFLCRGECFHPAPSLHGRSPGRPDEADLDQARAFALKVEKHILENRPGPLENGRPDALVRGWGFYDWVALFSKDAFIRMGMPKPRQGGQNPCNQCGWCVPACPTHSLVPDEEKGPEPGKGCIRCYRCLTGCPQGALAVNWTWGDLVLQSMYNTTFERWFGDMQPGETPYGRRSQSLPAKEPADSTGKANHGQDL